MSTIKLIFQILQITIVRIQAEYIMEISEDGTELTVSSPIEDPIVVRHYLLFSFKASNHGTIRSGRKSWD